MEERERKKEFGQDEQLSRPWRRRSSRLKGLQCLSASRVGASEIPFSLLILLVFFKGRTKQKCSTDFGGIYDFAESLTEAFQSDEEHASPRFRKKFLITCKAARNQLKSEFKNTFEKMLYSDCFTT